MLVHLSPKAKALTLPLNWSQFLKTLIGAENYTLFQLPPNKTSVRPARRPSLSLAILCCLSSSSFSSTTITTPSFARSLPLGYFFFRREQSLEISTSRDDDERSESEWEFYRCDIEPRRPIKGQSVGRVYEIKSLSASNLGNVRLTIPTTVVILGDNSVQKVAGLNLDGASRLPF